MFEPIDNFRDGSGERAFAIGIQPLQALSSIFAWNFGGEAFRVLTNQTAMIRT